MRAASVLRGTRAAARVLRARGGRLTAGGPSDAELVALTPEDRRYLTTLHDDSVAVPDALAAQLTEANPRLVDLRRRYEALELPVTSASRWRAQTVASFLDLRHFRGETLFYWHYRELPRVSELKYYLFARYVAERDGLGLLERLEEDGAFGCWTFTYPDLGRVSRDLLESVNEIGFLDRTLALAGRQQTAVLDIGAGYGRLAHRMTTALDTITDFCCVDAVPEATFLSEVYLRHRGCVPPARVVALDRVETDLSPGAFDLALNVHSFSECPYDAIAWWVAQLVRLRVANLLIVPNEPLDLLSLEADGSRRDFAPLLAQAGYELVCREPVIDDLAVRRLIPLHDHFHLFRRRP